ncbi:Holo-[acyl-carrier protein] synthase [Lachnospiraceae bacterium TWA4]|nr:Holo-[acyl-carrier protein] synthase [Lachnospiraceae bacterium TWA4]
MIAGIGIDMIEVSRITKACSRRHFLERCYTIREVMLFENDFVRLAGNFAVKEAVAKSLGTGFRGFGLQDIEVLRDEAGAPFVHLYGKARMLMNEKKISKFHVSITNLSEYVTAFVVAEMEDV